MTHKGLKKTWLFAQPTLLLMFAITFLFLINFTSEQVGGYGLGMAFNHGTWFGFIFIFIVSTILVCCRCKLYISKSAGNYALSLAILLLPFIFTQNNMSYEFSLVLLAIGCSFLMFFIVEQFNSPGFSKRLLLILFISTLLQSAWALIQYYFVYEQSLWFIAADLNEPHGTFGQKNVLASYLAFGNLLAIHFLFTAQKTTVKLILFTLIVIIVNSHITMLAEARTGRIVPIVSVFLYLIYCGYQYNSKRVAFVIFVACCAASFTPKQWFDVRPNTVVTAPIGIQSLGFRPMVYSIGLDIASENLLTGIGQGNLPREFNLRKVKFEKDADITPAKLEISTHIHNEPLQWIIEFGLVSGLAFVGFFVTWVVGWLKGWLEPSILLLALPFVGHSMLELPFYASAPHLLVFATILGLASKGPRKVIRFPSHLSGLILPVSLIASYKGIAFLTLSLASMNALMEYRLGNEKDESLLYSVKSTKSFERFFTHEKYEWSFRRGIQQGSISKEQVFSYIDFLEESRMKWPEALLYIQLAEMYQISRQPQKAEEIMEEARAFFPWDERIIAYFEKKEGKS